MRDDTCFDVLPSPGRGLSIPPCEPEPSMPVEPAMMLVVSISIVAIDGFI